MTRQGDTLEDSVLLILQHQNAAAMCWLRCGVGMCQFMLVTYPIFTKGTCIYLKGGAMVFFGVKIKNNSTKTIFFKAQSANRIYFFLPIS